MGRPSGLTPEVHKTIVEAIRGCNTLKGAAALALISERTIMSWLARGRNGEEPYLQLLQDVMRAQEDAKQESLAIIRGAVCNGRDNIPDWRAQAWLLERRFPSEFGKRVLTQVQVEGKIEELLESLEAHLPRDTYGEVVRAIARIQGVDEEGSSEDAEEAVQDAAPVH